jgi:excisionase family DNA binding protein
LYSKTDYGGAILFFKQLTYPMHEALCSGCFPLSSSAKFAFIYSQIKLFLPLTLCGEEDLLMPERWVTITVPEMTVERYAQQVGVTTRTVEGWIAKGYIPTIKMGRRRLVNVAARMRECLVDSDCITNL